MQSSNFKRAAASVTLAAGLLLGTSQAFAGAILFVADSTGNTNIPGVLASDGHTVTSLTNQFTGGTTTALLGDLTSYDAVFWSASGGGFGSVHTDTGLFTNLSSYVNAGGRVLVTGYDTVASPTDTPLINFLGATSSTDFGGSSNPGPVTGVNSLSTGLIDIVGVSPTNGFGDWDTLFGLTSGTACVAQRPGTTGGCAWTLRTFGAGEIAYISNGQPNGEHASWTNTSSGGDGAWNAAIRNFAANAPGINGVPAPGALALLGLGFLGLGVRRRTA